VEFIVVTSNDETLEQIGQVLDDDCTVRHVDAPFAASVLIRPARPYVVLLDSRGHADLATVIESVQSPEGTAVVVVLVPAEEIAAISRSVRGSATFAILPIPIEPGQTAAVIDGAREEALARLTLVTTPALPLAEISHPVEDRMAIAEAALTEAVALAAAAAGAPVREAAAPIIVKPAIVESDGGKPRALWIGLALAAIAIGLVTWFMVRGHGAAGPTPTATATAGRATPPSSTRPAPTPSAVQAATAPVTAPEAVQDATIDDLLDRARGAMLDRRYTDPEGSNALVYFRSVLAQEPGNDEAHEGLQRVGAVLDERLQTALAQRKFDDAVRTIAQLKLVRTDKAAQAQLNAKLATAQIDSALAGGNVERASQFLRQAADSGALPATEVARWRDELNRRQGDSKAQIYAQLVSTRIREGKLLEPTNDSARLYLSLLRKLPSDPKNLAATATDEMQQAVLAKAQEAASRAQRAEMESWLIEARALGASPSREAAILRSAALPVAPRPTSPDVARPAPPPQDRIEAGTEPADVDSLRHGVAAAPVPAKQQQRQVTASDFKRIRYVTPEYPREALQKKLSGEVRVRITVDTDGTVKTASIISSNPPGVFDRAALEAVRRWRYKPIEIDGTAVEGSALTNLIFQPDTTRTP
jgi:TonB family protein